MHAHIDCGMLAAEGGRLREPRARHHHGRRREQAELEQVADRRQRRLAHTDVVGMCNQHTVAPVEAKLLQDRVHRKCS
jgi:hypothetical protein